MGFAKYITTFGSGGWVAGRVAIKLQTRRLTYKEHLRSPEVEQRYRIVDGQLTIAERGEYQ